MEIHELKASELLERYRAKELDPVEVAGAFIKRIRAVDDTVKSFLHIDEEGAMARAAELRNADTALPLYGVPVAVKDNMCTRGAPTTCGSKILHNFRPPYDATVVEKLKAAGAVILGKTNMDEFAMGSSTENSGFHTTRNPWDVERVPGGSSGGSAVAVAARQAPLSLGSDTGGSIRQPASYCGVVGLKPTYGAVSRYGLVAFASSLDQIGPFTRDVTDAALLMNVIGGHDRRDSTSAPREAPDYTAGLDDGAKGLRIGIIDELYGEGIDAGVLKAIANGIEAMRDAGAEITHVSMPNLKYSVPTYYLIAPAEASSNLARYDGVQYGHRSKIADDIITMFSNTRHEGFGDEVKRRIMLGTYALSAGYYDAYYLKAMRVRTLIARDYEAAFEKCDVLVSPTAPTTAFRIGEKVDDPLAMYLSDICTIAVNLASLPALSAPCGFSDGLPVGIQFIGRAFDEPTILRVAKALEKRMPAATFPL